MAIGDRTATVITVVGMLDTRSLEGMPAVTAGGGGGGRGSQGCRRSVHFARRVACPPRSPARARDKAHPFTVHVACIPVST
eukprot:7082303-Prymnesium_polylepis.1